MSVDVEKLGMFLEHQGFSDEAIDAYFEHHGVKGQKWGVSRSKNRALNKQSRAKDRAASKAQSHKEAQAHTKAVDAARSRVSSGKTKQEFKAAKAQFKKDKVSKGSREARKILRAAKAKRYAEISKSQEARDGREAALMMFRDAAINAAFRI